MNYKLILGVAAAVIGFGGYAPYIKDLFARKTKPHAFSWLAWGFLEGTAFFAQMAKGGGAGAWATGASALIALFISGVAFYRKDTEIHKLDYLALSGAIIGIIFWRLTSNPLLAVIFVTVADALAFIPTFRKSFHKPEQETLIEYGLSVIKWVVAIFALESYSLATWLYPVSLILTNGSFVLMSIIRKRSLKNE